MAQRGITAKERAWLASQLDAWRAADIIAPSQAARILDLYETPAQLADRSRSLLLTTLMGVAALLVAMAAMLAIGYNWQAIPAALKLAIIFTVLLATHGIGAYLCFGRGATLASEIAFFLGCLFFGAAIFLVAQIFHLSGHYPDTVWWWALGVLPFALCLDSVLLHALLAALLALWCGMETLGFAGTGNWLWDFWGHVPRGAYSLPLLVVPGLVWAYRHSSLVVVWLYVLVLAWWVVLQPTVWDFEEFSPFIVGAAGGILMLAAESHPRGSHFAAPYRDLGLLLVAGTLMLLGFYEATQEFYERPPNNFGMPPEALRSSALSQGGAAAMMTAVALAAVAVWYLASKMQPENADKSTIERMFFTAQRQWLALGIIALMFGMLGWWMIGGDALLPTVLANIAMIVLGFWMLRTGLHADSGRMFAAGVVYLLLWAVTRYIDMFGDFGGMLGAAGVFLLCGMSLFAVAWFWRQRKEVLHV